jgi:hypothetical protein
MVRSPNDPLEDWKGRPGREAWGRANHVLWGFGVQCGEGSGSRLKLLPKEILRVSAVHRINLRAADIGLDEAATANEVDRNDRIIVQHSFLSTA